MSIDTSSEEWRHSREVNYVLSMESKEERREYLDGVEKRRGFEFAQKLRNDVKSEWLKKKPLNVDNKSE